jgi:phosphate transport system ATP-binding protein
MNKRLALALDQVSIFQDDAPIVHGVTLSVPEQSLFGLLGPSHTGKSLLLGSMSRMNDFVPGIHLEGQISFFGQPVYHSSIDPEKLRKQIVTVFSRPYLFNQSIFDTIAWAAKLIKPKKDIESLVQGSLEQVQLWTEVKDKLNQKALKLSAGQQQRLCLARALVVNPKVILLDDPTSTLDPISTSKFEQTLEALKDSFTLVVATSNIQQIGRLTDTLAILMPQPTGVSEIVEQGSTQDIFLNPQAKLAQDFLSGTYSRR